MQHLKYYRVGPRLQQRQLGIRILPQDLPLLLRQEVYHIRMQPQNDIFFQFVQHLLQVIEHLLMNFHLKLQTLIEIAVRDYFDDNQRQRRLKVVFVIQHPLNLIKINSKFFFTHFISLFCHLFYIKVESFFVINWQVDINCE